MTGSIKQDDLRRGETSFALETFCGAEKFFAPTKKYQRRSIRLKGYDYSKTGVYFITICTHNQIPLFGQIVDGEMNLNEIGRLAERCWITIPAHFPQVGLDEFIIMPNHIHGILVIKESDVGAKDVSGAKNVSPLRIPQKQQSGTSQTIGSIIRGFKIGVTKEIRQRNSTLSGQKIFHPTWQRNYYEHIIRDEADLIRVQDYIMANPAHWHEDKENPVGAKDVSPTKHFEGERCFAPTRIKE
jgi:REP element-mobilizing transposase RayT